MVGVRGVASWRKSGGVEPGHTLVAEVIADVSAEKAALRFCTQKGLVSRHMSTLFRGTGNRYAGPVTRVSKRSWQNSDATPNTTVGPVFRNHLEIRDSA